jgi:hypothetical protein
MASAANYSLADRLSSKKSNKLDAKRWCECEESVDRARVDRHRLRVQSLLPAAAVEVLRTVTGSAPEPFVGPRDDGPDVQTTGFSFEVKSDSLAHAIADTAAVLFRAKGFTLFVFGAGSIGVGPGTLVLTPDREPYRAIEAIGTSGGFIFPTTPRIVKSLLKDVRALAKRFYSFCPDIVRQGTRSVGQSRARDP